MAHPRTIAAIATAPGRGAVAIVRVSGPASAGIARTVFRGRALRDRVASFGTIVSGDGTAIDEGLALFFAGPRSYTGEDVLELHVHGSPVVARDVLLATIAAGASLAEAGEFTRRAFYAGKLDLSQAEAVADLVAAEHRSAARGAAARLSGGLAREVDRAQSELATVLETLTAALDFPDEVDAPARDQLAGDVRRIDGLLAGLVETYERGRLVREGLSVAIVGPPNAGKSSLLNALLGSERALVSATAGTTRDTVEETLALPNGGAARLIDTAGIRTAEDELEAAGIARTERAFAEAGAVLVVLDGSAPLCAADRELLARTRARDRVVYFNKSDLGRAGFDGRDERERDAILGSTRDPASVAQVSARLDALAGGDGVDLARPHLGTARQVAAVVDARRSLAFALRTLACGAPVDLIAGDLGDARAALAELTGRGASEALLDAIFARFCIGK